MKKQINEIRRMQQLAGIIKENNENQDFENYKFKIGDKVMFKLASQVDPEGDAAAFPMTVAIRVPNASSIPEDELGYYHVDFDAYDEEELNNPWYSMKEDEGEWYSENELVKK